MSWSTVAADIVWDPSTWTSLPDVTEVELSSGVQSQVLNALEAIYNTGGVGQTMLDGLAGAGPIRIATVDNTGSAWVQSSGGSTPFFDIDPATDSRFAYINDHGKLIAFGNLDYTLAHELAHDYYNVSDPAEQFSPAEPDFDFSGVPDETANAIAPLISGLGDVERASYQASRLTGTMDASALTLNHDYTDGHAIDIAIVGHITTNDDIDISNRTDNAKALLMGLGGNDTIVADGGNSYLYGGTGQDSLRGGAGDDKLDGGSGNDTLVGGNGDDLLVSHAGSDSISAARATTSLMYGLRVAPVTTSSRSSSTMAMVTMPS